MSLIHAYAGCAPNGTWIFRSKIFGGLSGEVTLIFNESKIVPIAKRRSSFSPSMTSIFHFFFLQEVDLIPKGGFAEGKEVFLGDSAYTRAKLPDGVQVRCPVSLPEDGTLPKVFLCGSFLQYLTME